MAVNVPVRLGRGTDAERIVGVSFWDESHEQEEFDVGGPLTHRADGSGWVTTDHPQTQTSPVNLPALANEEPIHERGVFANEAGLYFARLQFLSAGSVPAAAAHSLAAI
jgi:hypothetical protein